jgi:maleylacetate reductase
MNRFTYTVAPQQVVFGESSIDSMREYVSVYGWKRLMLCTSPHLVNNGTAGRITNILREMLVATFGDVRSHVPDEQVTEALALARAHAAEAVIGMGGGSAVGMAKAVGTKLDIPSIAIPTTYAGSEMTPVYGITHTEPDGTMRKVTVRDNKIIPRLTIYDPELTRDLPPGLTASTGINALAHCIEAVYSRTRNPLSTGAALQGIRYIDNSLVRCYADGNDMQARIEMLAGAHLGGVSLATVEMGLHHGTGHVLGGTAGIPHGVANCVVLPHAVRFNAKGSASHLAGVADALNIQRNGLSDYELSLKTADYLCELISTLRQPQRLRDAGVDRKMLPRLAENMLKSGAVKNNPTPLTSEDAALEFLESMW